MEQKSLIIARSLFNIFRGPKVSPFPKIINTFMGRDAISLAVSHLDLDYNDSVLLPAYICLEALKPFMRKARVEYYELNQDLSIDPDEIKKRIAKNNVKLVMIINYFGFLQPYRRAIRSICAEKGIILMEDCAHSLLTQGSGETGDLSIFSYAKILPVPDGGGVQINREGESITPVYYPKIYSNILSCLIIMKSVFRIRVDLLSRAWLSSRKKGPVSKDIREKDGHRFLPISSFSFNGLGNIPFSEIIEKRRQDYEYWLNSVGKTGQFAPLYDYLPLGTCPLGFPVKVENRDFIKNRLRKNGIYLKTHWHLPETVGREFTNSHRLSSLMLTLPVYPELGPREREGIQGS